MVLFYSYLCFRSARWDRRKGEGLNFDVSTEINLKIISKHSWQNVRIRSGDRIECHRIRIIFQDLRSTAYLQRNGKLETIALSMKSCFKLAINHLRSSHPPYRFLLSLPNRRPSTGNVFLSPRSCFGVGFRFIVSHYPRFTCSTATRKGAPGRSS